MAGIRSARIVSSLVLLLGLAWLTGCAAMGGGGSSGSSASGVTVTPAAANVGAEDTQQFSAKVSTMDQTVTWAVNGTTGGNTTEGRICTTGVYTAPAALPTPNSVSIEATSSSNPSLSGKSSITPENPVPTVTAGSPTAVPVGNFSIAVTGTNFVDGAKVMFGGQAMTKEVRFVDPARRHRHHHASQKDATVQGTVTNPDPGSIASAGLMVKIGVPPTTVAITPANVQLHPGETVQFKAVVSAATNQAAPWEVNSVAGGNSKVGTISASGLYTPRAFCRSRQAQSLRSTPRA